VRWTAASFDRRLNDQISCASAHISQVSWEFLQSKTVSQLILITSIIISRGDFFYLNDRYKSNSLDNFFMNFYIIIENWRNMSVSFSYVTTDVQLTWQIRKLLSYWDICICMYLACKWSIEKIKSTDFQYIRWSTYNILNKYKK